MAAATASTARARRGRQTYAALALAALAAALVLSPGIGAPFAKDQETQSAQWIQAIVQRGEWLLPRDDYGGIDRKPPLYYWLSALAVKAGVGRVDEANARAVSLLAGVALAVATMRFAAVLAGEATGWLALAFVLGTYGFASRATVDLTDMLLSFLLFAAWWCIYRLLEEDGALATAVGGGLLLGLAVLTKGPVAIVLIGLAGIIYLALTRRSPIAVLGRGWPWIMLVLAAAIAACWYAPAFIVGGRLAIGVFVSENFGHFLPAALGGTGEASRPAWYIAMRMLGGALPQSLLVVAVAIALWRRDGDEPARRPLLFQLSLVLAVLIFFSAASAKRDDYILPAMPGLAILFAALFTGAAIVPVRERAAAAWARDVATALIALGAAGTIVGATWLTREPRLLGALFAHLQSSDAVFLRLFLTGMLRLAPPFAIFTAISAAGALLVLAGLGRRRPLWSGAGLAAVALAGSTLFAGTLRPELADARSMKTFAAQVHRRIGAAPLYIPSGHDYELSFYYGRGIPALDATGAARLAADGPAYIVARPREVARMAPALRERMEPLILSGLIGGGGPPALYRLTPAPSPPTPNSSASATR